MDLEFRARGGIDRVGVLGRRQHRGEHGIEVQNLKNRVEIFVLWGQAETHHVVGIGHAFHDVSPKVRMGKARREKEGLPREQLHRIEKEEHEKPHVFGTVFGEEFVEKIGHGRKGFRGVAHPPCRGMNCVSEPLGVV